MAGQIDKLEHAFANAGTTAPKGRAQRMADRSGAVDAMVVEGRVKRPKIRRARGGAYNKGAGGIDPLPRK